MFFEEEKNWLNPLCKYLEAALKESKRIFDFDKFLGDARASHFLFDLFYIVDFHSAQLRAERKSTV